MIQIIGNNRFLIIFFIPFILGSLSTLSFQPFNLTVVNFVTIPILFLILSYVNKRSKNIYRKKPRLKNLFYIGCLFGFGFFLSGNYWISYSLTFDDSFKYLIPISLFLLPLLLSLFFGVATAVVGPFIKNNFSSILLFSAIFSLTDFLRAKIFTGFPWNLWAYSWSWFADILQILNPIGIFAFNLIIITLFCFPAILFFDKYKHKLLYLLVFILTFLALFIYGSYSINKVIIQTKPIKTINIKIISPNFSIKNNLLNNDLEKLFNKLIKYSEPENSKKTIFIWPEGVFTGFYLHELKKFKKIIKNKFSEDHLIIFGANTQDIKKQSFFNSLVVINNNFDVVYKYNKQKLVPFGEFLPFEHFLISLGLKKITHGYGSFTKGIKQKNLEYNDLSILPVICYEIIFPEIFQNSDENTNLIINISEDAWFGSSIGPYQHFAKAIFRSIENNSYLARSANKGISAFIDNNGKIIKNLKPNEAGSIELDIPILENKLKNKNDLIFFLLLITYMLIFLFLKKND